MLFGHLLSNSASGFSDVRTYWSKEAVKQATGYDLDVPGLIHLINSGATTMDATGLRIAGRQAGHEAVLGDLRNRGAGVSRRDLEWVPANLGYFRGGGFSSRFLTKGGMPITLARINRVKGLGPVLQIAEGYTYELPAEYPQDASTTVPIRAGRLPGSSRT